MADLDWRNRRLAHLTQFTIADTMFFLSLWEINSPGSLCFIGSKYAIKIEAFPNYSQRITSYKECAKGSVFIGYLPAENIESQDFKDRLKCLILDFFIRCPKIIEEYNWHHPEGRIKIL